jgi:hypothetical protein
MFTCDNYDAFYTNRKVNFCSNSELNFFNTLYQSNVKKKLLDFFGKCQLNKIESQEKMGHRSEFGRQCQVEICQLWSLELFGNIISVLVLKILNCHDDFNDLVRCWSSCRQNQLRKKGR